MSLSPCLSLNLNLSSISLFTKFPFLCHLSPTFSGLSRHFFEVRFRLSAFPFRLASIILYFSEFPFVSILFACALLYYRLRPSEFWHLGILFRVNDLCSVSIWAAFDTDLITLCPLLLLFSLKIGRANGEFLVA